ncbi:SHOCT domain-containing protein [Agarivorans sp. TSD2052]|uniref:SHOCT domain-containing protein n=1 Tax=Agarivorans sp. TSD2052 TaxID=2937286 RepID=UPI00200CC398|nr:SHOCT domain-containing protein [Agarivorans sp. TSD2052]UPW17624.1 SHOCT domain-containing protein [Agarivorans sp. TSD2052]
MYTTSFKIIDPNASSEAVKIAIYDSLTRRGWTVDEQNNLQTVAHLHKRTTKAKVVIDYSSTHVDINTTGTRTYSAPGMSPSEPMVETEKTFNPRGWIKNIVNDTKRLLPNAINQVKDQETSQESLTAQLSELKQLFEQGLISEEIYLEKQRNILQ